MLIDVSTSELCYMVLVNQHIEKYTRCHGLLHQLKTKDVKEYRNIIHKFFLIEVQDNESIVALYCIL